MQKHDTFRSYKILPGNTRQIELGNMVLLAQRTANGWCLDTQGRSTGTDPGKPVLPSVRDYYLTGRSNSLLILPALPAKPLVFKAIQLHLLPNQKLTFFVKIPMVFQLYYSRVAPANLLKEIESRRLSDTWFGEPDSGEPAYMLGSEYCLQADDPEPDSFEALCPVTVKNSTLQTLDIQRLILRVENMALYKNGKNVVCSLLQIEYKGTDVISTADYLYAPEFHGEKQEMIAEPRIVADKRSLKINFHFIRNRYKNE